MGGSDSKQTKEESNTKASESKHDNKDSDAPTAEPIIKLANIQTVPIEVGSTIESLSTKPTSTDSSTRKNIEQQPSVKPSAAEPTVGATSKNEEKSTQQDFSLVATADLLNRISSAESRLCKLEISNAISRVSEDLGNKDVFNYEFCTVPSGKLHIYIFVYVDKPYLLRCLLISR